MGPKANFNSKKAKLYNSRVIKTENNDSSIINRERLSIPEFLDARSFEIKAFELAQLNSKYASATRVFQNLPRVMRRRTASHNVKRIPKRLRNRALREMNSNPTNIVKKSKSTGRQLYQIRMAKKLLKLGIRLKSLKAIPNPELYNKKLNLRVKLSILNQQAQQLQSQAGSKRLNNILGSYDNTGIGKLAPKPCGNIRYYKRQNQFVWLPTHIWHAKRFHMIKQYGFQIPLTPTQKCFRLMNRQSKQGTILFDTCYYNNLIVEIKQEQSFKDFILNITKYKNKVPETILYGKKSYIGWLKLNDKLVGQTLIYANIQTGKMLIRVHPSIYEDVFEFLQQKLDSNSTIFDCRYSLGSLDLSGPNSIKTISKILHLGLVSPEIKQTWIETIKISDSGIIPVGTTFSFDIRDPRFWKKPSDIPIRYEENVDFNVETNKTILKLVSQNLVELSTVNNLLSSSGRKESYNNQLSIKSINREFSRVLSTKNSLDEKIVATSKIPILITKTSAYNWCLIAPWYWILPLWICAVKIKQIKIGGIKQIDQINFEHETGSFPQDYPWLRDGWQYNESIGKLNQEKYNKIPKHHKKDHLEDYQDPDYIGPFKCDWTSLRNTCFIKKWKNLSRQQLISEQPDFAQYDPMTLNRTIRSLHDLKQFSKTIDKIPQQIPIDIFDKNNQFHQQFIEGSYQINSLRDIETTPLPLMQISVKIAQDGTIHDNARIYPYKLVKGCQKNLDLSDVIGFISTGNLNLNSGVYQGIGLITAQIPESHNYLYIRNVGETKYHLVDYKLV